MYEANEYVARFEENNRVDLFVPFRRCRKRIRASWDRLVDLSIRAQVPDEAILDFEASVAPDLEVLVGGIRASPRRIADISEHPALVALIMSRLAEKVKLLEDNLEKVNWDLDSESTLAAVAGDGAVETVRRLMIYERTCTDISSAVSIPTTCGASRAPRSKSRGRINQYLVGRYIFSQGHVPTSLRRRGRKILLPGRLLPSRSHV